MRKRWFWAAVFAAVVCLTVMVYIWAWDGRVYEYVYSSPATLRIERDTLKLDTVKYGEKRHMVFRLKNTGDSPLLIRDVRPSCGCTGADWNKRPVRPGQQTEIRIVFEPNSLGRFHKSIDVLCNTVQQVHKLNLRGVVVE